MRQSPGSRRFRVARSGWRRRRAAGDPRHLRAGSARAASPRARRPREDEGGWWLPRAASCSTRRCDAPRRLPLDAVRRSPASRHSPPGTAGSFLKQSYPEERRAVREAVIERAARRVGASSDACHRHASGTRLVREPERSVQELIEIESGRPRHRGIREYPLKAIGETSSISSGRVPRMAVLNVHHRKLACSREVLGALIDELASEEDRLWPRRTWPPMHFDRPLAVGADGGHGPIRYRSRLRSGPLDPVSLHRSARLSRLPRVRCEPSRQRCLAPTHLAMRVRGPARLSWPLVFRPLHDALVEDSLDLAERAITGHLAKPARYSRYVRLLRRLLRRDPRSPR